MFPVSPMAVRNDRNVESADKGAPEALRGGIAALRLAITALAVLVSLAGYGRAPAREPGERSKNVAVAVTTWPADAALFVARDKGYFDDEGIDAAFLPNASGHLGLGALLSGEVDFATSGETPIARAAVEGKRFAVIATISEIDHAIVVVARRDRGVSTPYDLKGKRVGLVAGTTAEFYLDIFLTTLRIDPKKIRVVSLAPEEIVEALASGEVDAVSTWEPHTTALTSGSDRVLLRSDGGSRQGEKGGNWIRLRRRNGWIRKAQKKNAIDYFRLWRSERTPQGSNL